MVTVNKALTESNKKRFDLMVSGAGKAELKKMIDNTGISYQLVLSEINLLMKKAREEK